MRGWLHIEVSTMRYDVGYMISFKLCRYYRRYARAMKYNPYEYSVSYNVELRTHHTV